MDSYISFFNLKKNYNKTELDKAYIKKLSNLKKMNLTTTHQKIFQEKVTEIYNVLNSSLDNVFDDGSFSSYNDSYKTMFRKGSPMNHKLLDPFSSMNTIVHKFFNEPFMSNKFGTDLLKDDMLSSTLVSQSRMYQERVNSDGSRVVINQESTNMNGNKNKVVETYEINKDGHKTHLPLKKAIKLLNSDKLLNSYSRLENKNRCIEDT